MRPLRFAAAATVTGILMSTLSLSTIAEAHQPVFVDRTDRTAKAAPLLRDGTVSFAIYGRVDSTDDERWVRAKLRKGDTLLVELLIPNQEPERGLPVEKLPKVSVTDPRGRVRAVPAATNRRTFDEPFSGTSYVYTHELREPAKTGTYAIRVTGQGPARFTLVIGTREVRGTVDGESPSKPYALQEWWTNPGP